MSRQTFFIGNLVMSEGITGYVVAAVFDEVTNNISYKVRHIDHDVPGYVWYMDYFGSELTAVTD